MNYHVYIIKSQANGDIYVGSTSGLENRLRLHNAGRVKSTKGYRPWLLLESHSYNTRGEAVLAERYFKTGQQKEALKRKYL